MGMPKLQLHDDLIKRGTHNLFEEWNASTSGGLWTTTADGGATAIAAGQYGILTLPAVDTNTNRQVYVATTNSLYLITSGHALMCEAYLQYSEANTNKANVM